MLTRDVKSQLRELSAELEGKHSGTPDLCSLMDAVQVPDIIHSTVMRVASRPLDGRRTVEELTKLRDQWEPTTVKVEHISLVYEKHPYMHLNRTTGEAHTFRLPFC